MGSDKSAETDQCARVTASAASNARASTLGAPAGVTRPPLVDSAQILRGHTSVEISHQGVLYRLQATRLGKLILTK